MGSALLDLVNAAYPAMAEFYASDWAALEARNEGLYVYSGCAITASGTAGKVDMSAGVIFSTTTELNVTAVTAASTTITSIADATNPKWVGLEIDSSGVLQFNQGTAAASPVKPALTAARVIVAWLYVPAAATAVDALLSNANGKAKIMDARQLMSVHQSRRLATDVTLTSLSNPTALATLLAATVPVPANSLNIGDILQIEASGRATLLSTGTNSAIQFEVLLGSAVVLNYTSAVMTKDGASLGRQWKLSCLLEVGTIAQVLTDNFVLVTPSGAATTMLDVPVLGTTGGFLGAGGGAITSDQTVSQPIDLQARFVTSSAGSTITLRHFSVVKHPA